MGSSMGHSEVAARSLAISICTSIGCAVSNVGCRLTAMIATVDEGTASGQWRDGGLEMCSGVTYVD
jgi:hypothetical protein